MPSNSILTLIFGSWLQEMSPSTPNIMLHMRLRSLKWLVQRFWRCIYKKIHYFVFDIDLDIKVTLNIASDPLSISYDLCICKVLSCNVLLFRNIIHYLTSDLDCLVAQNGCLVPSTSCDLCSCKVLYLICLAV